MMVFGVVYAAQVGMALIPFKQAALTVIGAYEKMSGVGMNYASYMLVALVACALCSLLFIVIGKYVFRPDVDKLRNLDASQLDSEGSLRLNKVQKTVLGFLFALVALLLLPNFLPAGFFLTRFLKAIVHTGICYSYCSNTGAAPEVVLPVLVSGTPGRASPPSSRSPSMPASSRHGRGTSFNSFVCRPFFSNRGYKTAFRKGLACGGVCGVLNISGKRRCMS